VSDRIYLGIHSNHDASAALMINGEIVAAAIEERFTRKKKDAGFPKNAIDFCLKESGIKGSDITKAVYTMIKEDPFMVRSKITANYSLKDYHTYYGENYILKKIKHESDYEYRIWLRDDEKFNNDNLYFDYSFMRDDKITDQDYLIKSFQHERKRYLSEYLGIEYSKISIIEHHFAHACYP